MLRISFGTRIDSAQDPLVTKNMEIGLEFMNLTGKVHVYRTLQYKGSHRLSHQGYSQTRLTLSNHYSGFQPVHGRALASYTTHSSMYTAR